MVKGGSFSPLEGESPKNRKRAKQRAERIRRGVVLRLMKAREEKRISKRELSHISGLGRTTVRGLESGAHSPSLETLIIFAEGIGVDLSEILKQETETLEPWTLQS